MNLAHPPERGARRVARNTLVQAAAEVVGKLAALAFYVTMARTLGGEAFGAFTFAAAVAFVFVAVGAFGVDYIVTRDVAQASGDARRLLWSAIWIKLVLGVLGTGAALAFGLLAESSREVLVVLALMSAATLAEVVAKAVSAVFRGLEDAVPVGIAMVVQRVGTAAIGVPLLLAGADAIGAAALYLLGAALGLAWLVRAGLRRQVIARPSFDVRHARRLLVVSIPIGLNDVFGVVLARVDVGILALLSTTQAVGLYGAGYRLFEATLFLSWAFAIAALPAFSTLGRTTSPTVRTAFELGLKATALVLFPIGTLMALFAPLVVDTVYGPAYAATVPVVRWLGAAAATYGFFLLPSYLLVGQGRQRPLAWVSGTAVILNVALNLVLIPAYGVRGAAAAMVVSQLFLSVLACYFAIRTVGAPSPRRVFAGAAAGCAAMAAAAAAFEQTAAGIGCAALGYVIVAAAAEQAINRGDVRRVLRHLRLGAGTPEVRT